MSLRASSLLLCLTTVCLVSCGGGGVAGKYSVDIAETKKAIQAEMEAKAEGGGPGAAMIKPMISGLLGMIDKVEINIELKSDGTWTGDMTAPMEKDPSTVTGTYKVDGDQISMTGTDDKGKTQTITGTIKGEDIHLKMGEGEQTMTMILKRK